MFAPAASKWFQSSGASIIRKQWKLSTYNCQSLPPHRPLSTILNVLRCDFTALQGTGSRWGWPIRQGNLSCHIRNVSRYRVYTWPLNPHSHDVNKSCGIIIATDRRTVPANTVTQVFAPPPELEGRLGGIRIRLRSGPDLTVLDAYFPPSKFPGAVDIRRHMYEWIENIVRNSPIRTTIILSTDTNARLGTSPLITPDGIQLIGTHTGQRENAAGSALRTFLLRNQLTALNTVMSSARGHTWYCTRGFSACVDYIITQPNMLNSTVDLKVLRRLGHYLQLPNFEVLADHVPILWTFLAITAYPQERPITTWTRPQVDEFLAEPTQVTAFCYVLLRS